jgi:hypothetical protein
VSVLSLIAFFALSAYAPDFRDDSGGDANAVSRSAIGFAGLRVLLNADAIDNEIDRGQSSHDVAHESLTIAAPRAYTESKDLAKLVNATGDQRQWLVILPKWFPFGDPLKPSRVMKGPAYGHNDVEALLKELDKSTKVGRHWGPFTPRLVATAQAFGPLAADLAKIDSLQTISGNNWIPLVSSADGGAVLAKLEGRPVYVLADPDLMNTHGLSDLPTAALAVSMIKNLRSGNGPVHFDVTLNGLATTPSLLRKVFEPPFLGATLCAILAAMLMAFHAAIRFGTPPAPPPVYARGKAALVGNAADMIRMLHREPRMAVRYAQATRNLVLRALGVRRALDAADSDMLLKNLERGDQLTYSGLLAEAQTVSSRATLVAVARRFYEWRQGMFHAD